MENKNNNIVVRKIIVSNLNTLDDNHKFDNESLAGEFIRSQAVGNKYMMMPSYEVVSEEDMHYRATIIMPVWKYPKRTLRAIESVLAQNTNGWELIVIGDCCPDFQRLIKSRYFEPLISSAQLAGNNIKVINLDEHYGGFGYKARNMGKKMAHGEYVLYLDNDDRLMPEHLAVRLGFVENAEEKLDIVAFDTWNATIGWQRQTAFEFGRMGHSEIIIRTAFLRTLPDSDGTYGHDWTMIQNAIGRGCTRMIVPGSPYTYHVMSTKENPEQGID